MSQRGYKCRELKVDDMQKTKHIVISVIIYWKMPSGIIVPIDVLNWQENTVEKEREKL